MMTHSYGWNLQRLQHSLNKIISLMGRSHTSCAPLRCAVKAFLVFSLSQRSDAQSMRERHFIWFSLILAFAPETKTRTV